MASESPVHAPADPSAAGRVEVCYQTSLPESQGAAFELNVDFCCPGTGVTAVFGPSGCGKTTLLRCMAGLQPVNTGRLVVNGDIWHSAEKNLLTHQRPLAYVFQEASLFAHLSARANLEFARRRAAAPLDSRQVEHIIALLDISRLLDRTATQLSGGERQRVAIARALLINPRLLLMDEPLAALDTARKQEILPYLESLHEELSLPILYVTHSIEEVARLADHLLVMESGRIQVSGRPGSVLADARLQGLFGEDSGAVIDVTVAERDRHWQLARVVFDGGELWVRDSGKAVEERMRLRIPARDVSLSLEAEHQSSILNRLPATISQLYEDPDQAMTQVSLELGDVELLASISRRSAHELALAPGMRVWAQIKSVAILR